MMGADSQCALTISIALGFSSDADMPANYDVQSASSSNIGAPWPIYKAGIVVIGR